METAADLIERTHMNNERQRYRELNDAEACAESSAYKIAARITGDVERAGYVPSGDGFDTRHDQRKEAMGRVIEYLQDRVPGALAAIE